MLGAFSIYVGGSTDDTGIIAVRFSSDDVRDNVPTGEWTRWYDWDISSEDWDAVTKIKRWSFATSGPKEVWAEVKDESGQTNQSYGNIFVHPGYAVIITGEGRWWAYGENLAIFHVANNVYKTLRNLGFNDDHIFYLNSKSPQDIDKDGDDEVDMPSSLSDFEYAIIT